MRTVLISAAATVALAACAHSQPTPPAEVAQPAPAPAPTPAPPAPAPPAPRSVELLPASIYFDFDSSELRPDARSTLQTFFDQARQRPDLNARIEGTCDERGSEEYNLALGQRRANSAKKYLVELGLDATRINAVSNGKERPRSPGHDEAAWSENRRDDLLPATAAVGQASR